MSITAAQRVQAIECVCQCALNDAPGWIPSGTPVASVLPGTTAAEVWSTIATALGTTVDAQLTTILANAVNILDAQLASTDAAAAALTAQITAITVV